MCEQNSTIPWAESGRTNLRRPILLLPAIGCLAAWVPCGGGRSGAGDDRDDKRTETMTKDDGRLKGLRLGVESRAECGLLGSCSEILAAKTPVDGCHASAHLMAGRSWLWINWGLPLAGGSVVGCWSRENKRQGTLWWSGESAQRMGRVCCTLPLRVFPMGRVA